MTPIAIWILGLGITDLMASPGGMIASKGRGVVAGASGGATVGVTVAASGYGLATGPAILLGVGSTILFVCWTLGRHAAQSGNRPAARLLTGLGITSLVIAATSDLWPDSDGGVVLRWISRLPFEGAEASPARAAAAGAAAIMLVGTGNAAVRLALRSVSVDIDSQQGPEERLRGGRLIGPIERLLIFALARAGQPTAAALIISAKGLLRFPELNTAARDTDAAPSIDVLTEYLLVGSIVSWALALAPMVVLP